MNNRLTAVNFGRPVTFYFSDGTVIAVWTGVEVGKIDGGWRLQGRSTRRQVDIQPGHAYADCLATLAYVEGPQRAN